MTDTTPPPEVAALEDEELLLFPADEMRPSFVQMMMPRHRLPTETRRRASAGFVKSVRRQGIFQPFAVTDSAEPGGIVDVAVGHRRTDAVHKAELDAAPVLLFPHGTPHRLIQAMVISENNHRSNNYVAEVEAVEALLSEVGHDPNRLAAELGLEPEVIEERMKLLSLRPSLRKRLEAGDFSHRLALDMAKFPVRIQEELATREHITHEDVRDIKKELRGDAGNLPLGGDEGPLGEKAVAYTAFLEALAAAEEALPEFVHPRVRVLFAMLQGTAETDAHVQCGLDEPAEDAIPDIGQLLDLPPVEAAPELGLDDEDREPRAPATPEPGFWTPERVVHALCTIPAPDPNYTSALEAAGAEELEAALAKMRAEPKGHSTRIKAVERALRSLPATAGA